MRPEGWNPFPCKYCSGVNEFNDEGQTWVSCDGTCNDHIYEIFEAGADAMLEGLKANGIIRMIK